MEIDVRAVRKLRESTGAQQAFGPLVGALCAADVDLAKMRVVCDWIQYRNNFRDTAMVRPVIAAGAGRPPSALKPESGQADMSLEDKQSPWGAARSPNED